MTYGQLKLRLVKSFPGVDLTLIEGWIGDRYSEILTELSWQRLGIDSILQTSAPYSDGSVTLTAGSSTVTGVGTTFTGDMSGRGFRVTGRSEFYEFTYASPTSASLDRAFEGTTGAGQGYKVFQHVYPMPDDCRLLEDNAFSGFKMGSLQRLERSQLNLAAPARLEYGTPRLWGSYMDDGSTPPLMQVELYPIPDAAIGIPFSYMADVSLPAQSAAFLTWVDPTALIEGVTARIKRHLRDYVGAEIHKREAAEALAGMRGTEAQGMETAQIKLGSYYTSHRRNRYCR